jgi:hypothetical protein
MILKEREEAVVPSWFAIFSFQTTATSSTRQQTKKAELESCMLMYGRCTCPYTIETGPPHS